jgi:hypothetical protein
MLVGGETFSGRTLLRPAPGLLCLVTADLGRTDAITHRLYSSSTVPHRHHCPFETVTGVEDVFSFLMRGYGEATAA